jgi:hypothetical protein
MCDEVVHAWRTCYGAALRAVILTGSLSRDEATFRRRDGGWVLLGDGEFVAVFADGAPLPAHGEADTLCRAIERSLLDRGLVARLCVSAVHPGYLRRLRPNIFTYELRARGQVVLGDREILSLIPAISPADIPREDAWRLLANRIVEQLEAVEPVLEAPSSMPELLHYLTVKLYLDMATSLLVFSGTYAPSYRERASQVEALAARAEVADWPFALHDFAGQVRACTDWKLSIDATTAPVDWSFWVRARGYADALSRWELVHLTGGDRHLPHRALVGLHGAQQPLSQRFRGWLYAARQQGWHRSWRAWPRWARLARQSSPRYWVYGAAIDLFLALPDPGAGSRHETLDCERLARQLPVVGASPPVGCADLARDISSNYHRLLVGTRS